MAGLGESVNQVSVFTYFFFDRLYYRMSCLCTPVQISRRGSRNAGVHVHARLVVTIIGSMGRRVCVCVLVVDREWK